jgi:hypothetical protein
LLIIRVGVGARLAGAIVSTVPASLANRVNIEFHAVKDIVAEPDTDIGAGLYVVGH